MGIFGRRFGHITRTLLLNGSPVNRVAKWTLALAMTAVWVYNSEKKKPRERGIFFRDMKAREFGDYEIERWNSRYKRDVTV